MFIMECRRQSSTGTVLSLVALKSARQTPVSADGRAALAVVFGSNGFNYRHILVSRFLDWLAKEFLV